MTDDTTPAGAGIGPALARVEAFARGVGRRTRVWGWLALVGGGAIWAIFLRRWVFDGWGPFLAWLPLLVALLVPGLVLLGFGRRVRRIADLPGEVSTEVGALVSEARDGVTAELAGVKTSGISGLRSLIGSLKDLRGYGGGLREIVAGAVGTVRLLNPLYLLVVLGSAMTAGLLAVLLVVAVVLLLV